MSSTGRLILLFIRHGETQDNIDRVLQGHRDTSLTDKGHFEAEVLASKLRNQHIDKIYHSPLQRITQTIAPILSKRPDIPTHPDPDLKGQYLGELEGGSYETIDMSNPRSADGRPGVELFDDFVRRLKQCLARIIGESAPLTGGRDRVVAIATHGVGITSLFKMLESSPACNGFNPQLATRGADAYEVRWTDSDDVSRLVIAEPEKLPVRDGVMDFEKIVGQPFLIEVWGKKEKALT